MGYQVNLQLALASAVYLDALRHRHQDQLFLQGSYGHSLDVPFSAPTPTPTLVGSEHPTTMLTFGYQHAWLTTNRFQLFFQATIAASATTGPGGSSGPVIPVGQIGVAIGGTWDWQLAGGH